MSEVSEEQTCFKAPLHLLSLRDVCDLATVSKIHADAPFSHAGSYGKRSDDECWVEVDQPLLLEKSFIKVVLHEKVQGAVEEKLGEVYSLFAARLLHYKISVDSPLSLNLSEILTDENAANTCDLIFPIYYPEQTELISPTHTLGEGYLLDRKATCSLSFKKISTFFILYLTYSSTSSESEFLLDPSFFSKPLTKKERMILGIQ